MVSANWFLLWLRHFIATYYIIWYSNTIELFCNAFFNTIDGSQYTFNVYPLLDLFSHFVFIFMNTSRTVVCNARNLVAMQFSTQQTDHKRWISVVYPLLELFLFFVFIFMNTRSQKLYNVWYRRVIFRSFIFENNWFKLF